MVLIEQGGVTADGLNTSNLYQLMVPAEGRKKTPPVGPAAGGKGVQPRTPSQVGARPRGGVESGPRPPPPPDSHRTRPGADRPAGGQGGRWRTPIQKQD